MAEVPATLSRSGTHYIVCIRANSSAHSEEFSSSFKKCFVRKAIEVNLEKHSMSLTKVPIEFVFVNANSANDAVGTTLETALKNSSLPRKEAENQALLKVMERAPIWKDLWFRKSRVELSSEIFSAPNEFLDADTESTRVSRLSNELSSKLSNYSANTDFLHIVVHGWDTLALFDIFAKENWTDLNNESQTSIQDLRKKLCSSPDAFAPVEIASLHTVSSPLSIFQKRYDFSKISVSKRASIATENRLPWKNFLYAGDLTAYPIKNVLPPDSAELPRYDTEDTVSGYLSYFLLAVSALISFLVASLVLYTFHYALKFISYVCIPVVAVVLCFVSIFNDWVQNIWFNQSSVKPDSVSKYSEKSFDVFEITRALAHSVIDIELSLFPDDYAKAES
ncbi:MAG TPA: hypothetical protein V6C76_18075 [Drouetiella sp.]